MIAMQYSLNQDEWVSTALSSMINDEQLGANLKSATSSCEVIFNLKSINSPHQLTLYTVWIIMLQGRRNVFENSVDKPSCLKLSVDKIQK